MLKEISALLGKETIDTFNTSDTRGSQRSYGLNYQKLEKELMTPNELAVMDGANVSCRCRVSVFSSRINLTSQNTRSTDTCQMQTQRMHLTWQDI